MSSPPVAPKIVRRTSRRHRRVSPACVPISRADPNQPDHAAYPHLRTVHDSHALARGVALAYVFANSPPLAAEIAAPGPAAPTGILPSDDWIAAIRQPPAAALLQSASA